MDHGIAKSQTQLSDLAYTQILQSVGEKSWCNRKYGKKNQVCDHLNHAEAHRIEIT